MMRVVALVAVLLVVVGGPVAAWSEDGDDRGDGPSVPEPVAWEFELPGLPVAEPPPATEAFVPEGIYFVTETYVRDIVTVEGPRTTYSTETLDWSPGTYARELETVGTGVGSTLDGAAFNERTTLSDGRSVAGTYYENFVRTGLGFIPVSIVFFQDDAELARVGRSPTAAIPGPPTTTAPTTAAAIPASSPAVTAPNAPPVVPGGAGLVIDGGAGREPAEPAGGPSTAGPRVRLPDPIVEASFAVRRGDAGSDRIEVLRGRRIALWPRATVDGATAAVLSWRLASGVATDARLAGTGADPFVGRWDVLAAAGASYTLQFRLSVAVPGDPVVTTRELTTTVDVVVLSPALER
ncbi:MAG: hypothetical protein EXR61_05945 [Chloroflexi bacterium]|nr:hypothetical protein [Chloroflexota bacterium]